MTQSRRRGQNWHRLTWGRLLFLSILRTLVMFTLAKGHLCKINLCCSVNRDQLSLWVKHYMYVGVMQDSCGRVSLHKLPSLHIDQLAGELWETRSHAHIIINIIKSLSLFCICHFLCLLFCLNSDVVIILHRTSASNSSEGENSHASHTLSPVTLCLTSDKRYFIWMICCVLVKTCWRHTSYWWHLIFQPL